MNPPATRPTRRTFLKFAATAAAAFGLPRFSIGEPGVAPNSRIAVACIGIAHRGWVNLTQLFELPNVEIVALCDVDDALVEETRTKAAELGHPELAEIPLYHDYREMYVAVGDRIDAVVISTPDHHHYAATMLAIQRGKHVYVEKPLTHSIGEARALRAAAKRHGVITQMGNQGRATEGIRLAKEWTEAGLLGEVREAQGWAPQFPERYFKRPESLPLEPMTPPPTLAWDLWLGPAETRPYHPLLAPLTWRGWWDFGSGTLGDWACHTLDAPFFALDLGAPTSVRAEVSEVHPELSPEWAEVTFDFPARGARPPVVLKWFEGEQKKPAPPVGWKAEREFPDRGYLMMGDEGTLFAPGGRPDSPRLLPDSAMEGLKQNPPERTIPRVIGGPMKEWIDAIAGGPAPGSQFDYSSRLTEMVLLGVVAMRTGRRIEWDDRSGRITNDPSLNRYVEINARPGWKV